MIFLSVDASKDFEISSSLFYEEFLAVDCLVGYSNIFLKSNSITFVVLLLFKILLSFKLVLLIAMLSLMIDFSFLSVIGVDKKGYLSS
jgi:hypothetical protein